jgi:hypothetical protein
VQPGIVVPFGPAPRRSRRADAKRREALELGSRLQLVRDEVPAIAAAIETMLRHAEATMKIRRICDLSIPLDDD